MIHLVFSLDYEIFGNGSGDVRRDMIEPTRRLLSLCDAHGAKLSIFPEVGEHWAMKQAEQADTLRLAYSPSQEIAEQLREAVRRGHDVQLHLHPWWIGASFEENHWRLHPQYLRITDLPHGLGSQDDPSSVVGVLHAGKSTLEALLQPVSAEYECLACRAGFPGTVLVTSGEDARISGCPERRRRQSSAVRRRRRRLRARPRQSSAQCH